MNLNNRIDKGNQQFRITKFCIHRNWINVRIKRNLMANDAVKNLSSPEEIQTWSTACLQLVSYVFHGFALYANLLN
ncbi:hypothetical protein GQX74_010631 [Glossina fuscipes]|nr:hypothetical protein GQX74_010631 [Glossina fuscipes]